MKREAISVIISFFSALIVAFIFDIWGGYNIMILWMWEIFVLLLANILAIKRIKYNDVPVKIGLLIDISVILILMVGYLSNFRTIEKFYYPDIQIIVSRSLIIVLYYLLCRLAGSYKRAMVKVISCILAEWLSIFIIVFKGGTEFEKIINESDDYVKAISGDYAMNVVSYYCMPGEKLFWSISAVIVIFIIFILWKIIKKVH